MSSSEVEARNIALSVEGSMDTSSAECLDTAPAPAPGSRRKSVENLVISSQDAIGQSISQALTFSGVITQHAQQIGTQENRNLSRSPSPCRPLQEPASAETLDNDKNDGQSLLLPPNSAGDTISISSQMEIASLRAGDVLLRGGTSPPGAGAGAGGGPRAKKKSWYSALYPTYKSRSDDFKRLFRDLPEDERLIVDYSCALQKDILAHGRLYVSQNYLCFYANIFGWETNMLVRWKDVTAITKEKTALVIPNAILVCTDSEKSFLTSFSGRDKAYLMLFRVWQNALMDQQMGSQEVWQWVHSCYGEELGFNSDDDEYVRDEDKMAAASLAHDTIGEEYLETSSLGGGDDPYSPARLARADDAISTTSLPTATTQHPAFARSVSQPPPPPITLTSPVSNGGGYEDAGDTLPTDMSDSSDSDPDKQPAGGVPSAPQCQDKHEGRCILHMEVACNIDQLFTMLFTNSKFCLELLATRNTSDYIQSPWKHNPETGLKCRQVSYTMALTQPIGPKCVHITETQVMNNCSKPGQIYSIDLSTMNAGVPYSDSFYVVNHYCMQRRSEQLTALYIYCSIKYKKSVWGIVKGFIEKNAWAGLEDYCRTLESALLRETDSERAPGKRKGKRRRRATSSSQEMSAPGASKSPAAVSALLAPRPSLSRAGGAWDAAGAARAPQRDTSGARWLLGILALLLLLNLLLYWKLYYAQPRPFVIGSADYDDKMGAASAEEWTKLLEQQSHERRGQLDSWSEALHRAIHTLRQTEQALGNLLETIRPSLEKAQAEGAEAGAAAAGEPRADL